MAKIRYCLFLCCKLAVLLIFFTACAPNTSIPGTSSQNSSDILNAKVSFDSSGTIVINENELPVFILSLSQAVDRDFDLYWQVVPVSAGAGSADFESMTGFVHINKGTEHFSIKPKTVDDSNVESSETFKLVLIASSVSNISIPEDGIEFRVDDNDVADVAPVASNISPASFNQNTQSIITLSYSDADGDLASSCSLSSLSNVVETQACSCSAGVCTVGVTGTSGYSGAASFNYTVTANSKVSNTASASLSVVSTNNPPVLNTNTGRVIPTGYSLHIWDFQLSSSDVESSDSAIIYTLEVAPTKGTLYKSGVPLSVGGTFTQQDISDLKVYYTHTAGGVLDDQFDFSVKDGAGAYASSASNIAKATFNIDVTADNCVHGSQAFTSDGTFNVPSNCFLLTVKGWGGGGGGVPAKEDSSSGGIGGGGGYSTVVIEPPPTGGLVQYAASIGLGGQGGSITCGHAGGSGGFNGGNGGNKTSNGFDGQGPLFGSLLGGLAGSGNGAGGDGGDGLFGGGGGGGGDGRPGGGGGGASVFSDLAHTTNYLIAGGGGGAGGDNNNSQIYYGGDGCSGNGMNAVSFDTGGGGGGGACYGDSVTGGNLGDPGNSSEASGAGYGGSHGKSDPCSSLKGSDGRIEVSY